MLTLVIENSKPKAKRRKTTPNWATVSTCHSINKHKTHETPEQIYVYIKLMRVTITESKELINT